MSISSDEGSGGSAPAPGGGSAAYGIVPDPPFYWHQAPLPDPTGDLNDPTSSAAVPTEAPGGSAPEPAGDPTGDPDDVDDEEVAMIVQEWEEGRFPMRVLTAAEASGYRVCLAPTPGSGGSAPAPGGGPAAYPTGGSASHVRMTMPRWHDDNPIDGSGGSAPAPSGGSAAYPPGGSGGSAPAPSGGSAAYPTGGSGGSAPAPSGVSAEEEIARDILAHSGLTRLEEVEDPNAETLLVSLGLIPTEAPGGSAPEPAPPVPGPYVHLAGESVELFREWLRGLQENILDEIPPDSPWRRRIIDYIESAVRDCWVRFLAECRWLRKDTEARFWDNKQKGLAHDMYKKLFKDIGKIAVLPDRLLAKKVGAAEPATSIATGIAGDVLDLTDIDSDSQVEDITEPELPDDPLSGELGDDDMS